jgi:hypothetical protein
MDMPGTKIFVKPVIVKFKYFIMEEKQDPLFLEACLRKSRIAFWDRKKNSESGVTKNCF